MSLRPEQEIIETEGARENSKTYEHPAFGSISASRVRGTTTLFDSDFVHQNFVEIKIHRAVLHRDLSHDWHFSRDQIIQVALSEAQWATFVSSLNVGNGVPCTLERIEGKEMPRIPLRQQTEVYKSELKRDLAVMQKRVETAIAEVEGEIGQSLSKTKREKILGSLRRLFKDVTDQVPFVAQSLEKHMEDVVEKAKIEVNAYATNLVMRTGAQALEAGRVLQLGTGPTPEEDQVSACTCWLAPDGSGELLPNPHCPFHGDASHRTAPRKITL
jgi:hypothetical protein